MKEEWGISESKPVCLILGAIAGGNVVKRFSADGYRAVLCRCSDEEGLNKLVSEIVPPNMQGRMLLGPDGYQKLLEANGYGKDELMIPAELADTYF